MMATATATMSVDGNAVICSTILRGDRFSLRPRIKCEGNAKDIKTGRRRRASHLLGQYIGKEENHSPTLERLKGTSKMLSLSLSVCETLSLCKVNKGPLQTKGRMDSTRYLLADR